jgi:hypothetical protein
VIPCVASVERRSRCVRVIPCRRAVSGVVEGVEEGVDGWVGGDAVGGVVVDDDAESDSGVGFVPVCASSSELVPLLVPLLVPVEVLLLVPVEVTELVRSPCVDPGTAAAALFSAISRVSTTCKRSPENQQRQKRIH